MPQESSLWFRLGYAAERALARVGPGDPDESRGLAGVVARRRASGRKDDSGDALTRVLSAGVGAAATRILERWDGRKRPGLGSLVRAGIAGATAALLVELARPLLVDEVEPDARGLVDELLAGAGAGLVYAALVEPRVPGPLLMRGAVYGTAEYAAAAWGGLGEVLKPLTPQERIPLVGDVLTDGVSRGRSYLEHLAFAVALAELYGEGPDEG